MEDTKKVESESVRFTLGKEALEILNCKIGDWIGIRSEGNRIIIAKADVKIPVVIMAMAVLAMALFTPAFAHGQEQVIVTQNGTITQPVPTPMILDNGSCYSTAFDSENRPIGDIMQIPIQGSAAFVPLRAEITYPKGDVSVFYFSTLPGSTANYQNNEIVSSGVASRVFMTDSVDNFNFVVGQRYSTPINQAARITIFGNNTSPLPGIEIPICGLGFAFGVNIATSIPPHFPSPEEYNKPIFDQLDRIELKQDNIGGRIGEVVDSLIGAANAINVAIIPIIGASVSAIAVAVVVYETSKRFNVKRPDIRAVSDAPAQGKKRRFF